MPVAGPNDATGNRSLVIELKADALMHRGCPNRFLKPRAPAVADSERLLTTPNKTSGLSALSLLEKKKSHTKWSKRKISVTAISAEI